MFDHAFIMDLDLCLACGKERPVVDHELCYECSRAMSCCITANNKVGHCPMCLPGSWSDLYFSTYKEREQEFCLTHAILATRAVRDRRKPDRSSHRGDVRHILHVV